MLLRKILGRMICFDGEAGGSGGGAPVVLHVTPPVVDTPKTFTQDEVNRIVQDRLSDEKKKAAEAKKIADMSEADRLKAEKDAAEGKVSEVETKANQRIVRTEAKVALIAGGANPARVDALVKLADLSGITIGDDGEPDARALKAAVDATLKDYPEFKAGNNGKSGADFSGGDTGGGPLTKEKIMKMTPAEVAANQSAIKAFYAAQGRK